MGMMERGAISEANMSPGREINLWKTRLKTRSDPFWNIFGGSFGGLCSLVVGFPLDTIKVRLQTQDTIGQYKNAVDCFRKIVAGNGFFSLFRGMSVPALLSTPRFALIFHGNAVSQKTIREMFGNSFERKNPRSGLRINYLEVFVSGVFSQLLVVPCLVAPVERIKVLLQVYPEKKFRGQFHCLTHLIRTTGFTSLWRGTLLTYLRDMPSFGTYFLVYELLRNEVFNHHETGRVSLGGTLASGAIAGICGWFVAVPFDTAKNRHQAVCDTCERLSSWSTVKYLYRCEGLRGFYRGAGPILLRAGPANAVGLLGYEASISFFAYCKDLQV